MSVQFTDERMNAITRMINTGESLIYSCGMFSTPVNKYKLWVASLSADIAIHSSENNKLLTAFAQDIEATFREGAQLLKFGESNEATQSIKTKGHLQGSGGIRGHSAGDIFPYIICIVGSFTLGFTYHLIGNGFKIGECKWTNYNAAHGYARALLNPLLQ